MPLHRRLPKRGFYNRFKKIYDLINVNDLNKCEPNSVVNMDILKDLGFYKGAKDGIKLLGNGELAHPVVIQVN